MSDETSVGNAGKAAIVASSCIIGLIVFLVIFYNIKIDKDKGLDFYDLAKISIAVVLASIVTGTLHLVCSAVLSPAGKNPLVSADVSDATTAVRTRIAPLVLGFGGAAIIVFGLVVAISLSIIAYHGNMVVSGKIDTILLGLFATILPVFSTWVGTILAFYFTNENYRQAAQIARDANTPTKALASSRMIPFEKIAKLLVDRASATKTPMTDVAKLFSDQVTRVIIFDNELLQPIYILRKKSPPMPSGWIDPKTNAWLQGTETVEDYRKQNGNKNAQDSTQFGTISASTTIEDARLAMKNGNCADLFVTATGVRTEPVIGWVTDDLLKSS